MCVFIGDMCGRTGLSLGPAEVRCACAYKRSEQDSFQKPEWSEEHNFGKQYIPSYNIAPTEVTPVIVSAANFGSGESNERIIKPMMWGMVPPWHKGNYKSHGLSTNNCRLEGMTNSKLYGNALRNGNRCVVVAEGFYEWQTVNSTKQPYYIFNPQPDGLKMYDRSTWEDPSQPEVWHGPNLLMMAGLYESWHDDEDETLYSYSIITMESDEAFSWLHHRVPAILESDIDVANWLDIDRVPTSKALSVLKPTSKLAWYPVSTLVNTSRNKSEDCNKPIDPKDIKTSAQKSKRKALGSRSIMDSWLKKSSSAGNSHYTESANHSPNKIKKDS